MTLPTITATCSAEVCDRAVKCRGWCNAHYKRWLKYGDPNGSPRKPSVTEKFMSSFAETSGGCWDWLLVPGSHGYGNFYYDGKQTLAHRWSYEHFVGDIPEGMQIDHLCRNRTCVNPAHLEVVTPRENFVRGVRWNFFADTCQRGHPRVESNTYVNPTTGAAFCRKCQRINELNRPKRRKANRKEVAA